MNNSEWVTFCDTVNFWDVQKIYILKIDLSGDVSMTILPAGFKEALYDYTGLGPPIRNYFVCYKIS